MKFHLPKNLMLAVLAAMSVTAVMPASALYVVGVSKVTNDATELLEAVTKKPGYNITEYIRPAVVETTNDAPVQFTDEQVNKTHDAYMPIYVREGTLVMTDGIKFNYMKPDQGCLLQVSGKDAKMVISNDAMFEEDHAAYAGYVNIGGPDGAGTLILNSGGSIHLDKSLTAGYHKDADWSSAQTVFATMDGTSRYADGQYETVKYTPGNSAETTRNYGKGTIEIDGDASGTDAKKRTTLQMGTAMFLAHTDMTIKNGGLLQLGTSLTEAQNDPAKTYNGWEGMNLLGRQHGCTTNFNIENGGEVEITGSLLAGGIDVYGVKINISVDGKATETSACGVAAGTASKLSVSHVLGLGVGHANGNSAETVMTVTNGGLVEAADVRLGLDVANGRVGDQTVSLTIDEHSSLLAGSIRLGKGATVVNHGTVGRYSPAAATYALRSSLPPMVIGDGASWTNSGTLDMDVEVQGGGTFIVEDGSQVGGLTSASGASITINGESIFNGDVSIVDSVLTFGSGADVTVNGDFVIDSDSDVYVQMDTNASADGTLFTVSSQNTTDAGQIAVTLVNANGDKCGWGYAQIGGNGDVTLVQGAAQQLSLSGNQQAFYSALQSMSVAGVAEPAVNALLMSQDEDAVKAALDAMSGHEYATSMSSQIEGNIGHLRRLRGAMGKGTALGSVTSFANCYIDNKAKEVTIPTSVTDSRNWQVGASAYHDETNVDSDARGDGYDRSESGAMLTAEHYVNEGLTIGGALSYGRTNLRTHGAKRRHEDNTRFDVYALYGQKGWSFATSLGLGIHRHEMEREVFSADTDGYSVNFMQDVAYTVLQSETSNVQLFGTLESSWNSIDSFNDGILHADSQDAWATDVTAGVRFNRALPSVCSKAPAGVFSVQTGVTASIGDVKSGLDMSWNGFGYRQESATRNRWGWNVGAGVDVPVRANVSLYATADAVLRGDSSSVDGQVGVRVSF